MLRVRAVKGPRWTLPLIVTTVLLGHAPDLRAQIMSHRGFLEGSGFVFPIEGHEDSTRVIGDFLAREEVSARPARWLLLAAGFEFRANTHDQIEDRWRLDFQDRTAARPRLAIRRLAGTFTRGPVTIDVGKQFVRWGKTDIVVPTDRFAPRDFLTVLEAPYLAITAVRATLQVGRHTVEGVWAPRFTPSRIPLLGQRWAVLPPDAPRSILAEEKPSDLPTRSQVGVRWGQIRDRFEYSLSFYDGFNHLPDIRAEVPDVDTQRVTFSREYPAMRAYGADTVVPLRWFALKSEAAYFTSSSELADEYVLYVVQLERQRGEWLFVGGYAGEAITKRRARFGFAPDRGLSHAIIGRASNTIDSNRSVEFEGAVRQDGRGLYLKAEYSQASGQHWRTILAAVALAGARDDFIGQYRRNSHVRVSFRYSF